MLQKTYTYRLNDVYRKSLPIKKVFKAIYNQSKTNSAVVPVQRKVQKGFSCCYPLQKLIFASNSTCQSDLQNWLNDVYRKVLPIEAILKAIYNQSITMAEAGLF